MRYERSVKLLLGCFLALALPALLSGQNLPADPPAGGQQPAAQPGPRGQAPPPQPGARGDAAATLTPAAKFLNSAIEINAAEVQLGQLATTKAQSDKVKVYAEMLVKDHSAALDKLQKVQSSDNSGNPLLSSEHQGLKTRLSGQSGTQFDRTFMDAMVTGHRDAVKLFEQEIAASPSRPQSASKPTDSDVLAVAKELLPSIKHHLDEGEKIQKGLKK